MSNIDSRFVSMEKKMPSSKSKKSKKKRSPRRKRLEKFKRKLAQGHFKGNKILINPAGLENISDVLVEFINPFIQYANTDEAYHKLLSIAVLAWNTSFYPETEQQNIIDECIDLAAPSASTEVKKEAKDIINTLIKRKQTYFADYKRLIVDYQLIDMGKDYHLTVASTTNIPSLTQDNLNNSRA
jgi:hypothetical protein